MNGAVTFGDVSSLYHLNDSGLSGALSKSDKDIDRRNERGSDSECESIIESDAVAR
jgi:hypothetical protein